MNTTLKALSVFAVALVASLANASEWELDSSHTTAQFTVRHMMVTNVRGQFQKVSGTVSLDDKDPTKSRIEVLIDASSIDTREPDRDAHLKSPDFFDVAKHPNITFKSTRVEKAPAGGYKVTGDLTMRGVTKPAVLLVDALGPPAKAFGKTVRGVSATGKINRKDWGLTWNKAIESGGVLVGEEVSLQIDAELVAKRPSTASN
jgi:polyisoprenoid-binding protein YceI